MSMRLRDLGPMLIADRDGERACSGPKQGAVLSMLVMKLGHRVSIDELMIAGWGYDQTVRQSNVENHIWRLRRTLELDGETEGPTGLHNEAGGYRLSLPPDAVDSQTFTEAADRARRLLDQGDAHGSLRHCDEALILWRGAPYELVQHVTESAAVTARLGELRGQLIERRVDALLALGGLDRALTDLQALVIDHPFRERLWGQRMTALARSGRTADALATFQQLRSLLLDELGLEPGVEIQELHRQILDQELDRVPARREMPAPSASTAVRGNLPGRAVRLVGRDSELSGLDEWLQRRRLVTLVGPGGCGKTRLAVELARRAAGRFPDGVWFVDLTTVTTAAQVVDAIASALGLMVDAEAATADTLADYLADRSLLLLVDNCEHVLDGVAELLEELLPHAARSAVLATSREPIDVDDEAVWPLSLLALQPAGDDPTADASHPSPAAQLFLARTSGRPSPDRVDPADLATIELICRAVDGLPLAIELAAARTRSFTLAEIASQVSVDPSRLGRIGRGAPDHRSTVWSTIEWSYQLLDPTEQRIHRRLSVLPGPFTLPVATAVTQGTDLDVGDIPDGLSRLVRRSLLVRLPGGRSGKATFFRQLDTVRAHGRGHLEQSGEDSDTAHSRDRWVLQLLARRPRLGHPDEPAWYDALDSAYPAVRATLQQALDTTPDPTLLMLGARLVQYWHYRGRSVEGRRWLRAAVTAAEGRAGEPEPAEMTVARVSLAGTMLGFNDLSGARAQLDTALPQVAGAPIAHRVVLAEALIGVGNGAWGRQQLDLANALLAAATELADDLDDPRLDLSVAMLDCMVGMTTRGLDATGALAEKLYRQACQHQDRMVQYLACAVREVVAQYQNDPPNVLRWIELSITHALHLGTSGGGIFLEVLANYEAMSGNTERAVRAYAVAQAETRRVGQAWPLHEFTNDLLDGVRNSLDPAEFERLWASADRITFEDVARARGLLPEQQRPGFEVV